MDLDQLEALALADDRAAALAGLVPGSEDHDYWHAIDAQRRGALTEVDAALESWPTRHGRTARYDRLVRRQRLLAAGADLAAHADALADALDVSFDHQPDVEAAAERYPNQLDAALLDPEARLDLAVARDLDEVTALGLPRLLTRPLRANARRRVLERLDRVGLPGLVEAIAADLAERNSGGFGSLAIHDRLTAEELDQLAALRPTVRVEPRWVLARLARRRPLDHVDWIDDLPVRVAHLDGLIASIASLPPVFAPLVALVRYHRLCCDLWLGTYDHDRLRAYLALPRTGAGASAVVRKRFERSEPIAIDRSALDAVGLPAIGDDSAVVRTYLHALLAAGDSDALADVLDPAWLTRERAEVRLLAGDGDARWAEWYGAGPTAALRDRVDLEFAPDNPSRWDRDRPVTLTAMIKNVAALRVRVFRINVPAWFDATGRDVDESIDLDGLTAGWEELRRFDLPPVRRHRVALALSACDRPGLYVVELIGGGRACRAIVRRGDLRAGSRAVVGGTAVEVFDERGQACADAWLRLGGLTLRADARGTITVPLSTRPGPATVLLGAGDVTAVTTIATRGERYELTARWWLDRQALLPETTARALAAATLTLDGAPVPLALVEDAYVEWVITDRRGVELKQRRPVALSTDEELVVELPLPPEPERVAIALGGRVRVVSEQRHVDVRTDTAIELGALHATALTAGLHLRPSTNGYRLALLGKSGEPRPGRAVALRLHTREVARPVEVTLATDERGELGLGELPDVTALEATVGEVSAQLVLAVAAPEAPSRLVVNAGDEVVIPTGFDQPGQPLAPTRWWAIEMRGEVPCRDVANAVLAEPGRLRLRGLAPGRYHVRTAEQTTEVVVAEVDAAGDRRWLVASHGLLERSRAMTTSAAATVDDDGGLVIDVAHASPATRVHVIATAFAAAAAVTSTAAPRAALAQSWGWRPRSRYVSGRDIGDEYRYVLDRQHQPRRAGSLLDKPSLLLNPWALRATSTAIQHAAPGGGFGRAASAGAPRPAPVSAAYMLREARLGGGTPTGFDFLATPARVLANLRPDDHGRVTVPADQLGDAAQVQIIVVDPSATTRHLVHRRATVAAPRDLRLATPLPLDRHLREDRRLDAAPTGAAIAVADRATTRVELIDTVDKLYRALCALSGDATLARWDFVPRWACLPEDERLALYSRHACHELALFIHGKDRPLFDRALAPYLRAKLDKTFLDRWLLDEDLSAYFEPWRLDRLNALELALLARRHPDRAAPLVRRLADAVDLIAPDPGADERLVDTVIAGGRADGDGALDHLADEAPAAELAESQEEQLRSMPPPAPSAPRKKMARRARDEDDDGDLELRAREEAPRLFRAADRTQEWAEHNWFERRVADVGPDLIGPARLWRDLAAHRDGRFLSPHVVDAAANLPAAMAALALVDLPFAAGAHAVVARGPGATLTTGSDALVARIELAEVAGPPTGDALIGQSYFRVDDRWQWEGAEQIEKYVTGEFLTAVVYACRVVVTNPSSRRRRVSVLHQIPAGAIAVDGALTTATTRRQLEPYQSATLEYAFYFPRAGAFAHYGAQVTEAVGDGAAVLAAAPARTLTVVVSPSTVDATAWPHLAQRGSLDEVCRFLAEANLGRVDLAQIAWRCHDAKAFARLTDTLAARHVYDDAVWSYGLRHRDRARVAQWLTQRGPALGDVGPAFASPLYVWEPIAHGSYQHLEYAPLINARAHQLGARQVVLNDGLAGQWRSFLDRVAHQAQLTPADGLAAAHYLFALDRPDDAARALARVDGTDDDSAALQRAYLRAYAAVGTGDLEAARAAIAPHREHPVPRWRHRFAALAALLDEASGAAAPASADPDDRAAALAAAAAAQPTVAVRVADDALVIEHAQVTAAQVRYYRLDLELLFSRQPFFSGGGERFGYIEPGRADTVALPALGPTRVALPEELRRHSLVIEVVADGARAAVTHFAHRLAVVVSAPYGRLQVRDATTGAACVATYVKCFARMHGGAVEFFKDGYTDLCGRFDYATLSTDALDRVERFALLIADDQRGATVLEAAPPPR